MQDVDRKTGAFFFQHAIGTMALVDDDGDEGRLGRDGGKGGYGQAMDPLASFDGDDGDARWEVPQGVAKILG